MKVTVQYHALATLLPGKKPQYPFNMRLGGTQNWYGFGKEENLLPLPTTVTNDKKLQLTQLSITEPSHRHMYWYVTLI